MWIHDLRSWISALWNTWRARVGTFTFVFGLATLIAPSIRNSPHIQRYVPPTFLGISALSFLWAQFAVYRKQLRELEALQVIHADQPQDANVPRVTVFFKPVYDERYRLGQEKVREKRKRIALRNDGAVPAYNIAIAQYTCDMGTLGFENYPTILGAGQDANLEIVIEWQNSRKEAIEDEFQLKTQFEASSLPLQIQTTITYDSAHGRRFETLFTIEYDPEAHDISVRSDRIAKETA